MEIYRRIPSFFFLNLWILICNLLATKHNMTGKNEFGPNEKGWDFGFDKSQNREKTHFVHRTSSFKAVSPIGTFIPHCAVRALKWGHTRVYTTGVDSIITHKIQKWSTQIQLYLWNSMGCSTVAITEKAQQSRVILQCNHAFILLFSIIFYPGAPAWE